jgi:predicted alpha/beta superfamily hydrolase
MDRRQFSTFAALLAAGAASGVRAQEANRKFVIENTQIIPIHSKNTGRDHELVVILPAGYGTDPDKTYPVMYFLDAYWNVPMVSATYGNLVYDGKVPEFISVGLSYPSGANYGTERRIDYTITAAEPKSGGADAFLAFIMQEVAPLIEERFRARKTDRVLSGHSLGGLFTVAAAYKAPGFFAGHIALSPAASWDKGALGRLDDAWAKEHRSLDSRMFICYGTDEPVPFRDPIIAFQKQLANRHYKGLALLNYRIEGAEHSGVKGEGYTRGLTWVWAPKKSGGPSGLAKEMGLAK